MIEYRGYHEFNNSQSNEKELPHGNWKSEASASRGTDPVASHADWPGRVDPGGNPEAQGAVLNQSVYKRLSSGVWSCTAGNFEWHYTWDEFVQILEGEFVIAEASGVSYMLKPGDCVHFPKGLHVHWNVMKTVRKVFVLSTEDPLAL